MNYEVKICGRLKVRANSLGLAQVVAVDLSKNSEFTVNIYKLLSDGTDVFVCSYLDGKLNELTREAV